MYKNCNQPITSYGIICYRLVLNPNTNTISPEYLMVQRKDSLCYVEFMRGKYNIENISYIMKLLSNMTIYERQALQKMSFDDLWKQLWRVKECTNYLKEYHEAKFRFDTLNTGYHVRLKDSKETIFFSLEYAIMHTNCPYVETEWGFPKGRRNIDETDLNCALREFNEETAINLKYVSVLKDIKPLEEVFLGSNKVRYRHLYYIAVLGHHCESRTTLSRMQQREVKKIMWFSYHNTQMNIRDENVERKELFKRVNQAILKKLYLSSRAHQYPRLTY